MSRVGAIVYATAQGLGHLARDFYRNGVITDVLIFRHPHGERRKPTQTDWYPPGTPVVDRPFSGEVFERFLDDLQAVLFFETPFDWQFVKRCRERKVRTVMVPMYEWMLEHPPYWFDKVINPSLLDQEYFPEGVFLPLPVATGTWKLRRRARRFLHNAGHIGSRNHKGTEEILQAMRYLTTPAHVTVRSQEGELLRKLVANTLGSVLPATWGKGDATLTIESYEIPYNQLFNSHDVFVVAEKYNGASLPLQEARAAGMVVMTSDRFPMNTWLPKEYLIPVRGYSKVQVARGHMTIDEAVVCPQDIAAKIDEIYDKDIEMDSMKNATWAEENSWQVLGPKWKEEILR